MLFVWLSRATHSRGFGIQSPNDYRFVCNVINDHRAYKEYDKLPSSRHIDDPISTKLHRLCFRTAKWMQPKTCINITPSPHIRAAYISAGCPSTEIINIRCESNYATIVEKIAPYESVDMTCLSTESITLDGINAIMEKCNQHSVMIAEGIRRDKQTRMKWDKIVDSELTGVTFDLYYCGIAFFDTSRYKQNYIINF